MKTEERINTKLIDLLLLLFAIKICENEAQTFYEITPSSPWKSPITTFRKQMSVRPSCSPAGARIHFSRRSKLMPLLTDARIPEK
jgi:hypothetical protein